MHLSRKVSSNGQVNFCRNFIHIYFAVNKKIDNAENILSSNRIFNFFTDYGLFFNSGKPTDVKE